MPKRSCVGYGFLLALVVGSWGLLAGASAAQEQPAQGGERRFLYVAVPGIRDYLEFGGHGLLIFDIDAGHKFVKRIPTQGLDPKGKPLNVKGICANSKTMRLYISTTKQLQCFHLLTEQLLWELEYEG